MEKSFTDAAPVAKMDRELEGCLRGAKKFALVDSQEAMEAGQAGDRGLTDADGTNGLRVPPG